MYVEICWNNGEILQTSNVKIKEVFDETKVKDLYGKFLVSSCDRSAQGFCEYLFESGIDAFVVEPVLYLEL